MSASRAQQQRGALVDFAAAFSASAGVEAIVAVTGALPLVAA